MFLAQRRILLPWILSAAVMFGLSYLWHGVLLHDLQEIQIPLGLYLGLAALAYLVIGLGITIAVHQAIVHQWISLKQGFPMMSMLVGAIIGFVVYLLVFTLGVSFADHAMMHIVVDILWQMVEQGLGGLVVSLGIIYDMHRGFLEAEKGT